MAKCYTSPTICNGFDHANLVIFFVVQIFLLKIGFNKVCFYKYEHLKRFVWKDDDVFAY